MEMQKFRKPDLSLLKRVRKGIERKATRQHARLEVKDSLKGIEETGVRGDVGRIHVPINRDA
jgi:hypothetical protein